MEATMQQAFYSASTGGFYSPEVHGQNIPQDAVEVSNAEYAQLFEGQSNGKCIVADADGKPILADPPPEAAGDIRKRAIAQIRTIRAPMLDALSGIAGRASRKGDAATAQAADDASDALLDIIEWPAFMAATTYSEMQAAILARYAQIAAAAPASVQSVFREVFGK